MSMSQKNVTLSCNWADMWSITRKKINEINDFNLFFNMINVFFIDILLIGNLNQSDQIDYKCINSCI